MTTDPNHPSRLEAVFSDILALAGPTEVVQARSVPLNADNGKLAQRVLEDLTDINAEWLQGAVPYVELLMAKAQNQDVTDEDFIQAVEEMAVKMPSLFDKLNWRSLAEAMEKVQGAAMVNGMAQRQREFARVHD